MIHWMRRRLRRKKKKLPFLVVEIKMDEIDQTNNQLAVDEEGRLLEIPQKPSEAELVKLESDLKESIDQLKEAVLEREKEMKQKAEGTDDKQLPGLGEEELVAVLEMKMHEDKVECLEALKVAGGVCRKEGESLYKSLFSMIIKDSVDNVLKREVIHLTAQMCRFRNNIAKKLPADEEITDETQIDMLNMPQGFEEAYKVKKEREGNED